MAESNQAELLNFYTQYQTQLNSTELDAKLADYHWVESTSDLGIGGFIYKLMLMEFAQDIANSINHLSIYTYRLKAWSEVIRTLDDDQKLSVVHEFIEPIATIALNLPYVIRARFTFAAAHLAHQANRSLDGIAWKDNLKLDHEITPKIANKMGNRWKAFSALSGCLELINGDDFKQATYDFRNKYNHRISPRIEVGLTALVTRTKNSASNTFNYAIGDTRPLAIDQIKVHLTAQTDHSLEAFEAFKLFVREHIETMLAQLPTS